MVSFNGYYETIKKVYDNKQEHIFKYWDELSDNEKELFLNDISEIDFQLLEKLYSDTNDNTVLEYNPAPYIQLPETDDEKKEYNNARDIGIEYIEKGKVAAFIVAGGQGSRLGFDGPKGKYPVSPVLNKTLFQIHAEKILKYSRKYKVDIPWLIMTSNANHKETVEYLEENNYFGLLKNSVIVFPQNMIPSLDSNGKLILESKASIFKNPDGHGGSLTALYTSGALEEMKKRGIDYISYFQVDNPLVNIIDPVFIGFHIKNGADISSKALKKAYPEEKVGVFVEFSNKRIGVVEYSDLPDEKVSMKDEKGNIMFSSGSIAIHLFNREFVEKITSGTDVSLPFHVAKKKIKAYAQGKVDEVDGFKFEKFVFDALPLTDKNVVFEVVREDEFAPVKNASGVDSVDSAQELMVNQYKRWIEDKGLKIPENVKVLEISPLLAVEPDDIINDINIPDKEKVYLE